MCLFSKPRYPVEFESESRAPRRKRVVAYVPERRTERITETIIHDRPAPTQYVPGPRASTPVIRPVTPPRSVRVPSIRAHSPARIELVSVEETHTSPRASRVSVSGGKGKSRHGSRGGEEVYIERERERVRLQPAEPAYDTYRYVEGTKRHGDDEMGRRRSRSITYETNPRHSGRLVERERVVIEDQGRRREYYRNA